MRCSEADVWSSESSLLSVLVELRLDALEFSILKSLTEEWSHEVKLGDAVSHAGTFLNAHESKFVVLLADVEAGFMGVLSPLGDHVSSEVLNIVSREWVSLKLL